jgi:glutaryl-CoA dehydrogenase
LSRQCRFGIAWGAIGAAICYDTALRYSKQRDNLVNIAGFQLQQKLAEMITKSQKPNFYWRLGVLRKKGKLQAHRSMAKRNNVEIAINIAREARQMLGGMGITGEYSIMRHSMNLEV